MAFDESSFQPVSQNTAFNENAFQPVQNTSEPGIMSGISNAMQDVLNFSAPDFNNLTPSSVGRMGAFGLGSAQGLSDILHGANNLGIVNALSGGIENLAPGVSNTINNIGPNSNAVNMAQGLYPLETEGGKIAAQTLALGPFSPDIEGASVLGGLAKSGAVGGVAGALTNPTNPLLGGILGTGLGVGGTIAGDMASSIIPNLQTETAQAAERLGINLPLGEAAEQPWLKHFSQNVLTSLPANSMSPAYQGILSQLNGKAQNYMNSLMEGSNLADLNSDVQEGLQKTQQAMNLQSRANYAKLGDAADAINAGNFVQPNAYQKLAQSILARRSQLSQDAPEFTNINDPQLLNFLSQASDTQPRTLQTAMLSSAKLNELTQDAYASGNPTIGGIYSALKNAHDSDIENSLTQLGQPDLFNQWNQAKQFYANNVAPFNTTEMQQYLRNGSDPDRIIQSFVKTGTTERPTLLSSLMNNIPADTRPKVAAAFLARGMGTDTSGNLDVDTNKMIANYRSLGPQSRQILFGPQGSQFLSDLQTVKSQIPDTLANPNTGQTAKQLISIGAIASKPHIAIPVLGGANLLGRGLMSPTIQNILSGMRGVPNALAATGAIAAPIGINQINSLSG